MRACVPQQARLLEAVAVYPPARSLYAEKKILAETVLLGTTATLLLKLWRAAVLTLSIPRRPRAARHCGYL